MKVCNNCKINKPVTDFYTVNKRGKPTIYHICKECCAVQKQTIKDYYRDWELKKEYGITLQTYREESRRRNNCCDICGKKVPTLHVDHNHSTMKLRGYLCGSCNRGIGLLQDSKELIRKALEYMEKHE